MAAATREFGADSRTPPRTAKPMRYHFAPQPGRPGEKPCALPTTAREEPFGVEDVDRRSGSSHCLRCCAQDWGCCPPPRRSAQQAWAEPQKGNPECCSSPSGSALVRYIRPTHDRRHSRGGKIREATGNRKIRKQRCKRPGLPRRNPGCEQPGTGGRRREFRAVVTGRRHRRGHEITLPHPHPDHRAGMNVLAPMAVTLDNWPGTVHENHAAAQYRQLPAGRIAVQA